MLWTICVILLVLVGVGNGSLLHRWRADSPPVGRCCGGTGNPPVPGTQDCLVPMTHPAGMSRLPTGCRNAS